MQYGYFSSIKRLKIEEKIWIEKKTKTNNNNNNKQTN